jgi:hypothetical protein
MGADLYLPIPFSKACRVTLDDSVFYYAIDYRIYPEETKVKSFSKNEITANAALIDSIGKELQAANLSTNLVRQKTGTILKDQQMEIDLPGGEHAINDIHIKINSRNNKQMNRAAVLQIKVDGKQTVWAPVAEFFGTGVYAGVVKNANIKMTSDGWMISNWIMPYKNSAEIILKNYGTEPILAKLKVDVENYKWNNRSMYFNAGWHEEAPLNTPPPKDWNYAEITGKGKYVGSVLTVHSISKTWWGEGDEKIYIDGESFPSQLGTGLEDYYGFAWGMANYFNSPFISMASRDARGKDDWSGYTTAARMRLLDNIPFTNSFKLDIEALNVYPDVSFSVCVFWYGMPNGRSNITPDEKTILRKLPDFKPATRNKSPGEAFSDPSENTYLLAHQKGKIRFVGDQLDLLLWRDKNIHKLRDVDGDNVLGTVGYDLFGHKILSMKGLRKDSISRLPAFVDSLTTLSITESLRNAALFTKENKREIYFTGLVQTHGDTAINGLISFVIGKGTPRSFRLGIMLDNADSFNKTGKYLWISSSVGERSDKVTLARSNRVPDWYFFDLSNVKKGDKIIIHGSTEKPANIFSIGGLTFD